MLVILPYVYKTLQTTLNNVFGENVFKLITDINEPASPKFYLECADSTPQSSIDEALILANQNAQEYLQSVQLHLYEVLSIVASKVIILKEKPSFSTADVQAATDWLQNQSLPCPGCVMFVSVSDNITKQQAAEKVINYQIDYDNFINQVNTIKLTGQNNLMSATDIFTAKSVARSTRTELENLM